MKKRGFTLIELMGVLIIIGVLSLIIIPVVSNVIKEQKEKQYEQQIASIELMAKNFGSDNLVILPSIDGEQMYITLGQLKSMGYAEKSIINPITEEEISNCARVKITKNGNNYSYEYDRSSENDTSCGEMSGSIMISSPVTKYVKNNDIIAYIVTVSEINSDTVLNKYEIDKTKITLLGETDATYNVIEGNGVYRIVIRGGLEEGEIALRLESGAIIKNEIEDLVGEEGLESSEKIIVDNTIPTISFGTNGNNSWAKTANSTITVTDNLSGGEASSYKYIYTKYKTETPSTNFTSGSSYSQTTGTGDYYLIASACDNAGNCTTNTSNVFKMDNTNPTITFGTNGNSSWKNSVSSTITVSDEHSKGDTTTYKYDYSTNNSTTPRTTFTSGSSYSKSTGSGNYYLIASACDNAGNCTTSTTNVFKLDNTVPTINSVSTSSCSSNMRTITVNASDAPSGIQGYLITSSTSTPASSSFNSVTSSSWTSSSYSPGTYYAWVKDKANNISSYAQVSVASCLPTIVCNTNRAYTYHWPDGSNQTTDLTTTSIGECSVSATLPFVEGEVYTSSANIFSINNYDSYSVKRKVCNDAGTCITCDEENDSVSNCTGTQPSFKKTKGYCVNDYCTVEYILTARNSGGTATKTFTYYFKY